MKSNRSAISSLSSSLVLLGLALASTACGADTSNEPTGPGTAGAGGGAGVGGASGTGGTTSSTAGAGTTTTAAGASGASGAGGTAGNDGGTGGAAVDAIGESDASGDVSFDGRDATADAARDAMIDAVGDGPSAARQTEHRAGAGGVMIGYLEYLPPGYGDGTKRPVLFFFHGVGENGNGSTDLARVVANGPPKLIAMSQWPASRPFVVLSPQHRPTTGTPDPIYGGFDCWTPAEIHDFIAFATSHYDIDTNRIYVTGLSCGAMGAANYFRQYGVTQDVVAAVLIAGNADIARQAQGCALVQSMGLWAFHGSADNTVPIAGDNAALPAFMACMPRKDVRYTVYPGVDHDSWTRTYDLSAGNDIYAWLLGFTR